MREEDIQLVQSSWEQVETVQEVTAELFYARLFEIDPALEAVFPPESYERRRKFGQFVGATVLGLTRPEALRPVLRELGIRHAKFCDGDRHHANIATALLWALEKSLRSDFTPQIRSAWIKIYGALSRRMCEGWDAPRAA